MRLLLVFLLALWFGSRQSFTQSPRLQVVRHGAVNDTIVDALTPGGVVRTDQGTLITSFINKGDAAAGANCYVVRSDDEGKTWSSPYLTIKPHDEDEGLFAQLLALPDGRLLMVVIHVRHRTRLADGHSYRESQLELRISTDAGDSFQPFGELETFAGALTWTSSRLHPLANGDLIIPAYRYHSQHAGDEEHADHEDQSMGAGFFRSTDGGATWGSLEVAFDDPPDPTTRKQSFNETAFAVREDGHLIAYARVDVHSGREYRRNHMWRCESSDHGKTWSQPVETEIAGICPDIMRLPSGEFVLFCGLRDSPAGRRTPSLFTSPDGLQWQYRGHPYFSRTHGRPHSAATGGAQGMVSLGDEKLYVVFYASDPELPGRHKTYIDGCLLRL